MKLFSLTRSSGNYGTVVFSVIAEDKAQAIALAHSHYRPDRYCEEFYKIEWTTAQPGAILHSENNE